MKQPEGYIQKDKENKVSSKEVPLWTSTVSQAVVQTVRFFHDQGQIQLM